MTSQKINFLFIPKKNMVCFYFESITIHTTSMLFSTAAQRTSYLVTPVFVDIPHAKNTFVRRFASKAMTSICKTKFNWIWFCPAHRYQYDIFWAQNATVYRVTLVTLTHGNKNTGKKNFITLQNHPSAYLSLTYINYRTVLLNI